MNCTHFGSAAFAALLAGALAVGASFAVAGDEKAPPQDKPAAGEAEQPAAPEAPAFTVKDLDGKDRTLAEFTGKWIVMEWVNPGCPYVKKFYAPGVMQDLQRKFAEKGVVWLAVCSTNATHKDYKTAEQWKAYVAEAKVAATAVLLDTDGTVGKAYGAMRTPEMRIICPKGTIQYVGAIDDNKDVAADPKAARNYVAEFFDAVLADKVPTTTATTAYGCSIKYAQK